MSRPTLTTLQKEAIGKKLMEAFRASGFASQAKYATSIGISGSDYSNIANAKWRQNDRLLSVEKWLRIARAVRFEFNPRQRWVTAPTETYKFITQQLRTCQQESLCSIFCDEAGLGKTHAVREYADNNANAYYINGGAHARKISLVRGLAQAVGLNPDKGTTEEVFQDVMMFLKASTNPLIIIDEAGDLHNNAYMLIKRLYNELEFVCGIYLIGARGLKKRIDSAIRVRTNGFEEVFSRFGARYSTVLPQDVKGRADYIRKEAQVIAVSNGIADGQVLNTILSKAVDLRRVRREVIKSRIAA
jgi:DNA transposition AAA+ family ATPase